MNPDEILKQYVFIPKKPKMSVGKAASQVAHATFMALDKQSSIPFTQTVNKEENGLVDERDIIEEWKNNGMCVIVFQVKDTHQLNNVAKYLEQWNIPHHLYIDEGITEVDPMTPTALATGIIPPEKQWMFMQFELYK